MPQKFIKNTINFNEAVRLYYIRYDKDKTINRLKKHFTISQVSKMIKLFSNEHIHFPQEDKIWMAFRNKKIRDELDLVDPHDPVAFREKKEELALFFGVSFPRIGAIYTEESARTAKGYDSVDRRAHSIYKEEFINFQKEVESILDIGTEDGERKRPVIPY